MLAVTVLTSIDEAASSALFGRTPGELTSRLAKRAAEAGVEGVVCSPKELRVVAEVAPGLLRVTPGIRPAGAAAHDQRRTATPAEAMARGADLLVVGRPDHRGPRPGGGRGAPARGARRPIEWRHEGGRGDGTTETDPRAAGRRPWRRRPPPGSSGPRVKQALKEGSLTPGGPAGPGRHATRRSAASR